MAYGGRTSGFTLVEIVVVLALVGVLLRLSAGVVPLMVERSRQAALQNAFSDMRFALVGYAISHVDDNQHGYLPCPARLGGDGREGPRQPNGRCMDAHGDIVWGEWPSVTLGVAPRDPWGRPFRYGVSADAANAKWGLTLDSKLSPLFVCRRAAKGKCEDLQHIADHVLAVWVSLGPIAKPRGVDEQHNQKGERVVVQRAIASGGDGFDDQVNWLPMHFLQAALLEASRLP